jgi:hypothetical protein
MHKYLSLIQLMANVATSLSPVSEKNTIHGTLGDAMKRSAAAASTAASMAGKGMGLISGGVFKHCKYHANQAKKALTPKPWVLKVDEPTVLPSMIAKMFPVKGGKVKPISETAMLKYAESLPRQNTSASTGLRETAWRIYHILKYFQIISHYGVFPVVGGRGAIVTGFPEIITFGRSMPVALHATMSTMLNNGLTRERALWAVRNNMSAGKLSEFQGWQSSMAKLATILRYPIPSIESIITKAKGSAIVYDDTLAWTMRQLATTISPGLAIARRLYNAITPLSALSPPSATKTTGVRVGGSRRTRRRRKRRRSRTLKKAPKKHRRRKARR